MTALLDRAVFTGGDDEPTTVADELPELDADPAPGKKTRRRGIRSVTGSSSTSKPRRQPRTGGRFQSRAQVQSAMAEEIESYVRMIALTWSMSDEHCAPVLSDASANIARDLAALLARSEWIIERYETTSLLADCMKLLHSLMPVLRAVFVHHVARGAEPDDQEVNERVTATTEYGGDGRYAPFRPYAV